jgi:two-component system nitrogen regulation sensor histidine kinase NtrY
MKLKPANRAHERCAGACTPTWPPLHLLFLGGCDHAVAAGAVAVRGRKRLLLSMALGWWLVRRALEPLGYTRRFHDLLQDQQYAARLAAPA